jgi:hypothetical protein
MADMAELTSQSMDGPGGVDEATDDRKNDGAGTYTHVNESTGQDAHNYVFADHEQFAKVVHSWRTEGTDMEADGARLRGAAAAATITATDPVSVGYFATVQSVLGQFIEHNGTMIKYTDTYTQKLVDSHKAMAENEIGSTLRLDSTYES